MLDRRDPIAVSEAVKRVMKYAKQGSIEYVSINDCDQRYLGEPVKASHDVPPFDRAPYDGYAIRAEDSANASQKNPIEFEVIEEIGAGHISKKEVGPFQAIRIMTGALMPKSCNAVVMLELAKDIEKDGKPYMVLKRRHKPGENVSYQGSETKEGEILVEQGRVINPGIKALLATFGYAKVPVVKKPIVGLYATGTELLDVDEQMEPGKIRNSNSYMIAAQIKRVGANAKYYGKLKDDFDTCYNAVKSALDEVDMLITTGGVSVGDYDYMPEIYKKLGAEILFNKITMRPGSVTTVAQYNGKLLFGLSGNPSACFVGFELYARPIIRSWYMSSTPHLQKVTATLDADFPKANPFTRFVRSKLVYRAGKLYVEPSGLDKSNVVTSLVDADSLMILPGGTRGFEKGDEVEVLLMEDLKGSEWPWA
ncbi:molybdopterin molybdotransferase MoeA [Calidifontibacillus oryziterrae]|uniref:molybdopterin molybdotransferase MoeA n=1 Tax=Calidifontibacillus oryziterrae TaxID=1191699 RepID=UPI0002E56CA7|nr:gephyrin-like molybdotransferase Glp [Calidifontibacillus oryziterrae]